MEALRRDIDISLLERNLKLTPQQRIEQSIEMQRFAAELAEAGRKGSRAAMTDYRKALDTLRNGKVRFIVIGGVAGTAHGSIDEIAVDRDS